MKRVFIACLMCFSGAIVFSQTDTTAVAVDSILSQALSKQATSVDVLKPVRQPLSHNFMTGISATLFKTFQYAEGVYSIQRKGMGNTFSYGVDQRVDGFIDQSTLFNAPLGDFTIPYIDVDKLELVTNPLDKTTAANVYGVIDYTTKSPFWDQHIAASHEVGFNIDKGIQHRHQVRYAQAYGKEQKIAFKLAADFIQSADWTIDGDKAERYTPYTVDVDIKEMLRRMQYEPVSPTFTQQDKDDIVKFINWIDFNPIANPGTIMVDINNNFDENTWRRKNFQNLKFSPAVYVKLNKDMQLTALYRFAMVDAYVVPFFKYQLQNYMIHHPGVELKGKDFWVRLSSTIENTGNSYSITRTGEHFNNYFTSYYVSDYAGRYTNAYISKLDTLTDGFCAECVTRDDVTEARWFAKQQAANAQFVKSDALDYNLLFASVKRNSTQQLGSGFAAKAKAFNAEGEYGFGFIKKMKLAMGATYSLQTMQNNEWQTKDKLFHNAGAYINASKKFDKDRFNAIASVKFNYNTDFAPRGDFALALTFNKRAHFASVSASSGYVLPTYLQRYANRYAYAPRFWGNRIAEGKHYTYLSVQDALDILEQQLPVGSRAEEAERTLETFTVEKLKPQNVYTFEVQYKLSVTNFVLSLNGFYNSINNVTALMALVKPGTDSTEAGIAGEESGTTEVLAGNLTPFATWVNLPGETGSWGANASAMYHIGHGVFAYANYLYFGHKRIAVSDPNIISFNDFNMPAHKVNVGIVGTRVFKGLGFRANFRWVKTYYWRTDFVADVVPSYHTVDARIEYFIEKAFTTVYIGADNIYNNRHIEVANMPRIGAWYYAGINFEFGLKK